MAGRLKAYSPVAAAQGNDVAVFVYRFPSEFSQRHQQITDAARLVIGRRVMVFTRIYELFMFSADAPTVLGFFPLGNRADQLVPIFNDGIFPVRSCFCAHRGGLEMSVLYCQQIQLMDQPRHQVSIDSESCMKISWHAFTHGCIKTAIQRPEAFKLDPCDHPLP